MINAYLLEQKRKDAESEAAIQARSENKAKTHRCKLLIHIPLTQSHSYIHGQTAAFRSYPCSGMSQLLLVNVTPSFSHHFQFFFTMFVVKTDKLAD